MKKSHSWLRFFLLCSIGSVTLAGCGSRKDISVKGKVTLDGQPIPTGIVVFSPDASKNNLSRQEGRGEIQKDGSYELLTNGKAGISPGWYKVSVVSVFARLAPGGVHPPPKTLIHRKYSNPAYSGLEIEVAPKKPDGSYDLALKEIRRR